MDPDRQQDRQGDDGPHLIEGNAEIGMVRCVRKVVETPQAADSEERDGESLAARHRTLQEREPACDRADHEDEEHGEQPTAPRQFVENPFAQQRPESEERNRDQDRLDLFDEVVGFATVVVVVCAPNQRGDEDRGTRTR